MCRLEDLPKVSHYFLTEEQPNPDRDARVYCDLLESGAGWRWPFSDDIYIKV